MQRGTEEVFYSSRVGFGAEARGQRRNGTSGMVAGKGARDGESKMKEDRGRTRQGKRQHMMGRHIHIGLCLFCG